MTPPRINCLATKKYPFSLIFYSLPLIRLDLVLDIQWLEELGALECDWKAMTMAFQWQRRPHKLHVLSTPTIQSASLEDLSRSLASPYSLYAVCCLS